MVSYKLYKQGSMHAAPRPAKMSGGRHCRTHKSRHQHPELSSPRNDHGCHTYNGKRTCPHLPCFGTSAGARRQDGPSDHKHTIGIRNVDI